MIVVVTGASGFIGSAACSCLESRGHEVRRLVRRRNGDSHSHEVRDLADVADWRPVFAGADVVLHLAARAHVMKETAPDPQAAFKKVNVDATVRMARHAVECGVRRFVFVSSIGVNGSATHGQPFRESDTPRPAEEYSRSKLAAERELSHIQQGHGLETVVVRPPLIYGPGVKGNFLRMLRLVNSRAPVPLGKIENKRSLLGLGNLCDFLALCVEAPAAAGETFVVAEPQLRSTPQIFASLYAAFGMRNKLVNVPMPLLTALMTVAGLRGEFDKLCGSLEVDAGKATRLLGWRPLDAFEDEIAATVKWFLRAQNSA